MVKQYYYPDPGINLTTLQQIHVYWKQNNMPYIFVVTALASGAIKKGNVFKTKRSIQLFFNQFNSTHPGMTSRPGSGSCG